MNAPVQIRSTENNRLTEVMDALGSRARAAARVLATATTGAKNRALVTTADRIVAECDAILAANQSDVAAAVAAGKPAAFVDRLKLTPERISAMAAGLRDIAALADPVGATIAQWQQPNGLAISRVRTPLGVIGIIYESRPNVTADAGGLCIKAGNAAILRGGSDSWHSAHAIHRCLAAGLDAAGLPQDAIQLVPTTDRAAVGLLLGGLDGNIDVIVPRGGRSLVERVQRDARVPVFAHLEGICHVYVDADADLEKARAIVVNAKMRRTGICGAAETLLVARDAVTSHLPALVTDLLAAGCEVRGDTTVQAVDPRVVPAGPEDWGKEFLDAVIAVRVVDGLDAAIGHIAEFGSSHTEAIITENVAAADTFLACVDSAIVMHNASTQFADGGEFGMGAEIGIATGRMHARGPVGVEQLTSFKYVVRGNGQIRPA